MKEMLLCLLLAFCHGILAQKDYTYHKNPYVPYQDVMKIPGASIIANTIITTYERSFWNCAKKCMFHGNCIAFNYYGEMSDNCKIVDAEATTYNVKRSTDETVAVGFLRDRATKVVLFRNVKAEGKELKHAVEGDEATCHAKCDRLWSCQASLLKSATCYTLGQVDELRYEKSSSTRIVPKIKTDNTLVIGGVKAITRKIEGKPDCSLTYADLTAEQCIKKGIKVGHVGSWTLDGSYGTCILQKCQVYDKLEDNEGYISGLHKNVLLTGRQLKGIYREYSVTSHQECPKKCKNMRKCRMYGTDGKKCQIAGGSYMLTEASTTHESSFIEKSKDAIKRLEPCVFIGIAFKGPFLRKLKTHSVTDCWDHCLRDVDCLMISFASYPDGDCKHRRSSTGKTYNKDSVAAILRDDLHGSCQIKGVKFAGATLPNPPIRGVLEDFQCREECVKWSKLRGDCYAYAFTHLSQDCKLYGLLYPTTLNLVEAASARDVVGQIQF